MGLYFISQNQSLTVGRELQKYLIQHTHSIVRSPPAAPSWSFAAKHLVTGRSLLSQGSSVRKGFLMLVQNLFPCNILSLVLVLLFWDQPSLILPNGSTSSIWRQSGWALSSFPRPIFSRLNLQTPHMVALFLFFCHLCCFFLNMIQFVYTPQRVGPWYSWVGVANSDTSRGQIPMKGKCVAIVQYKDRSSRSWT